MFSTQARPAPDVCRIVVELDPRANFHPRIFLPQPVELIEIDALAEPVVIGERNVAQTAGTRAVDPGLQEILGVTLNAMALRMGVVIGKEHGGTRCP